MRTPSLCWIALASAPFFCAAGFAQSQNNAPSAPSRFNRAIRFSDNKPVTGLPSLPTSYQSHCAADGTIYVEPTLSLNNAPPESQSTNHLTDLYSIAPTGETASLLRALPDTDARVSTGTHVDLQELDFYVAEHTLVTLLQSSHSAAPGETATDTRYFISTSDLDGSSRKITALDIRFRPLKVALFDPGDFLVLGWDIFNLQPRLALIKEDGTVRRFVDLANTHEPPAAEPATSLHEAQTSARATAALTVLQRSAFVPYGGQVLLTYPGTTRPIEFLSPYGGSNPLPITYPSGYVLHQVFPAPAGRSLVLRAVTLPPDTHLPNAGQEVTPPTRLLEYSSYHPGPPIREFITTTPTPMQIACAPTNKLTALFMDTLPSASKPTDGSDPPKVLVIGSAPR